MAEAGVEILFLADRLGNRSDLKSLEALADGLSRLGHDCHFLSLSAPVDHGLGDLVVCPGLARRWQRPWTVRGLDLADDRGRTRIMHVLSARMADAALAIAERWKIPYLLGVEEFPRREFRLRLSRVWCRGLVVPNRELAVALSRDYGVPSGAILEVARGVAELEKPIRPTSFDPARIPVVGAAGDLVAGSGFTTFLNAARKVIDSGLDVEFLIAGQGEDEGDLRRRAERLRIAERLTFSADLPVGVSSWDVLDVYCQTSMALNGGRAIDDGPWPAASHRFRQRRRRASHPDPAWRDRLGGPARRFASEPCRYRDRRIAPETASASSSDLGDSGRPAGGREQPRPRTRG